MIGFAASAAFLPVFMLVLGLTFASLGAFLLSARGSAWARGRAAEERRRRPGARRGSEAWTREREEQVLRLLAFTWVVGGAGFAAVGVVVLAVG
ncbi:hypothetical protein ACIQI8_01470 [Streptomyces sp. NPDC092369]|uniref:hypothetical protein n=1 Tax=Streptomyces sp. NPDC092369 TaxID=3366015 RepID=UPI0037FABBB9